MLLKHTVEHVLCAFGPAHVARRRNRSRTLVIAYHNIVPDGEVVRGDESLHLRQRDFGRQLDLLTRTHEIVSLSEIHATPKHKRTRAIITFDDAYSGALHAGVSELQKRSMPATMFVAPAFVDGRSFWWDRLAASDQLSSDVREQILDQLAGDDSAVTASALVPERDQALPAHQRVASQADLTRAQATGLITFGSHSWSHRNLARLSEDEITEELRRSWTWLRERFTAVLPWISYPYGLHSPVVERVAAALGYTGGFLISGGYLDPAAPSAQRYVLPRMNVPAGVSLRGFELRAAGVMKR